MFWPLVPAGSVSDGTALMLAGLLPLAALLYAALLSVRRERRIPNQLVLIGIAAGLLLHSILPTGNGFLSAWPGGFGPCESLRGLATGAFAILPFYYLRLAGSGEVRLMAIVGAFLGPQDVVPALLGTFVAGILAALISAFNVDSACPLRDGLARFLRPGMARTEPPLPPGQGRSTAGREAPHAMAVAIGTLAGVLWVISGGGLD